MMRYGIISEVNYDKGEARVFFDELRMVSGWLTLPKNINANQYFAINTQVAVIMHENGEDGEILHSVPHEGNYPPEWASEDVEGFQFKDGSKVTYNSNTGVLTVDAPAKHFIFNCAKITVNGEIEATGDVKAGSVSLKTHTHIVTGGATMTAGGNPTVGTLTTSTP